MSQRIQHTDDASRQRARCLRDHDWKVADRIAACQPLYICWWNKNRHHDERSLPDDLLVCGLIDGMELLEWLNSHPDWWVIGEWDDARYASPVWITDAGRDALTNRHLYDMEPVRWGLVEPGHEAVPAERVIP